MSFRRARPAPVSLWLSGFEVILPHSVARSRAALRVLISLFYRLRRSLFRPFISPFNHDRACKQVERQVAKFRQQVALENAPHPIDARGILNGVPAEVFAVGLFAFWVHEGEFIQSLDRRYAGRIAN